MTGLNKGLLSAVKYNAIAKYSNVFVNLITGVILARLLTPEEYGVVAVVSVFVLFFGMLTTLGIGAGVVQFDQSRKELSALFTFSIIVGVILGGAFACFSFWIAKFYENEIYIPIGNALAAAVIIKAVSSVPLSLLQKRNAFRQLAISAIWINFVTGALGIWLAVIGFSYWSLIIRTISSSLCTFLYAWYLNRNELSLNGNFRRDINWSRATYSGYVFLFDFVNYFSRNLDNILIGKYMGSRDLGMYDKAYSLMRMPLDNLVNLFSPVLHPILSKEKPDQAQIFRTHEKILSTLSTLGIFISVICFFCNREIILVLYGGQWGESAAAFKWLGLSVWIQMILSSAGPFFLLSGNTKYYFLSGFLSAITMTSAIFAGIFQGNVEAVAKFLLVAFFLNLVQNYFILYKYIFKVSPLTLLRTLYLPFLTGLLGAFVLYFFKGLNYHLIVNCTIRVAILSLVFVIAIYGTNLRTNLLYIPLIKRR